MGFIAPESGFPGGEERETWNPPLELERLLISAGRSLQQWGMSLSFDLPAVQQDMPEKSRE